MELGPPSGMRDYEHDYLRLTRWIKDLTDTIYSSYGSHEIDTPMIERTSTVNSVYGEGFDKEVFWVGKDKEYLMRYDLTLPGARYVVNHGLVNFRRHQFGKVFRRDIPNIERGRYREFTQSDFDIYGSDNDTGLYDAEMLDAALKVLKKLGVPYKFQLNDRNWLMTLVIQAGVPENKIKEVCTTLDKLDKKSVTEIIDELITVRKLDAPTVSNIAELIQQCNSTISLGNKSVIQFLTEKGIDTSKMTLLLSRLLETDLIILNPLLARGLDYYTGIIYEVVEPVSGITFAAGGRYDSIAGVQAIGFSLGVDRVIRLGLGLGPSESARSPQILVGSAGSWRQFDSITQRFRLMSFLRDSGFIVTTMTNQKPKMRRQLEYCFEKKIPVMVLIGESEVQNGTVNIKDINKEVQYESVSLADVCQKINEILIVRDKII